jgi:hypothetical protein
VAPAAGTHAFHVQLADQMKEWEDFAKEPVKVLGSVS